MRRPGDVGEYWVYRERVSMFGALRIGYVIGGLVVRLARRGLRHRDLFTTNMIVDEEGSLTVVDLQSLRHASPLASLLDVRAIVETIGKVWLVSRFAPAGAD